VADAFSLFACAGDARELGRQHGEQARTHIARHLDHLQQSLGLPAQALRQRAAAFRGLFDGLCPRLVEELGGLAEGAAVTFEDALAVNTRAALGLASDAGCTAFAVAPGRSDTGSVLIGQNSDTLPLVQELAYVLRLHPADRPPLLMWTFGGMLGYHGLNAHGVAHFANDLGGGPKPRFALPHYPLKRLLLECEDLEQVRRLFETVHLASSGNYVLCDGSGNIADVEATPGGVEWIPTPTDGVLVHTNHFLGRKHATAANHVASAPDSFTRQRRMQALLGEGAERIDVGALQASLRDRQGAPGAICRSVDTTRRSSGDWRTDGITVASIVAEPARGRLHVAAGNGRGAAYHRYDLFD
jgi:isopenicillin-N N-acyltransferase-like protein